MRRCVHKAAEELGLHSESLPADALDADKHVCISNTLRAGVRAQKEVPLNAEADPNWADGKLKYDARHFMAIMYTMAETKVRDCAR